MKVRTPLTIITGSLGSGKTTLLRHILDNVPYKIAILMNEFGEIAIDSKIIRGKNVEMTELDGGCVCCSLIGEFEAAVDEIIETVDPEVIVVETTGVAEPDALIYDIEESLPQVRLDGILTIVDADIMIRFPQIGHTTRMQIEDADMLALNKRDLASEEELRGIESTLREINRTAPIIRTQYCCIDPDILFGIARKRQLRSLPQRHQLEYETFSFSSQEVMNPELFKKFVENLSPNISRGKGFVRFPDKSYLFNFVAGRWELEPFEDEDTALVFIGKDINKESLLTALESCEA